MQELSWPSSPGQISPSSEGLCRRSLWWSSLIFQTSLQPTVATAQLGGLTEATLLCRATRNDPWTAASVKNQQHGALRFLPSWHTSVTTCVDTEPCRMWHSLSALVQGRDDCSGQLVFENVPNQRAKARPGDTSKGGHAAEQLWLRDTPAALQRERITTSGN